MRKPASPGEPKGGTNRISRIDLLDVADLARLLSLGEGFASSPRALGEGAFCLLLPPLEVRRRTPVKNKKSRETRYPLRGQSITVAEDFDKPTPEMWRALTVAEERINSQRSSEDS